MNVDDKLKFGRLQHWQVATSPREARFTSDNRHQTDIPLSVYEYSP